MGGSGLAIRVRLLTGLIGSVISMAILAGPAGAAVPIAPTEQGAEIPGQYIVVLADSVDSPAAVARSQLAAHGGEVGFVYRYAFKGYSAKLPEVAVGALRRDPRVKYVTPDTVVAGGAQSTPTGVKRVFAAGNANLAINEKEDVFVNADVAVLDTGVEFSHPDINPTTSMDCVPPKEEPEVKSCKEGEGTDPHGHGTHVAGTVGALDNNFGVVGVAPGVRITSVRVLNASNAGTQAWLAAGIDWVTSKAENIEVANASIWCECSMPSVETAINAAVEKGVVFVTIAGNNGSLNAEKISPAKNPNAITVGAIADYDGVAGGIGEKAPCTLGYEGEKDDSWANFSSWGSVVDVVAPGVCINSTWKGKTYAYESGTSMAAPAVAGAAAILAAHSNPNNKTDVANIRKTILEKGNKKWTAEHEGEQQPLLDVSNEAVF